MDQVDRGIAVVVYDYETTGPEPSKDLPVQTAAVLILNESLPGILMNALSNPRREIQKEAEETHGVSQKMVEGQPLPIIVVGMLKSYVEDLRANGYTIIIAGQNHIRFDNPISQRLGWEDISGYPQIDTYILARRCFPTLINHKLGTLYAYFTGKELSGAHNAIYDVLGVAALIPYFCEHLKMNLEELAEYCGTPQAFDILPFSKKHKGKPFNQVGVGFMRFMLTKTDIADSDPDFVESVRVHYPFLYEAHCLERNND